MRVAARAAFLPELGSRSAPERRAAGIERVSHGFGRREREHAHLACQMVLHDDGDESVDVEVERQLSSGRRLTHGSRA